jgi:hypothetical protein
MYVPRSHALAQGTMKSNEVQTVGELCMCGTTN